MKRTPPGYALGLVVLLGIGWGLLAAEPNVAPRPGDKTPALPDLSEFKTAETATTTRISRAAPVAVGHSGYLGVHLEPDGHGKFAVADVAADSPAARAGVQRGDIVLHVEGQEIGNVDLFREMLLARSAGETVKLSLLRQDKPMELIATLGATSRPMKLGAQRASLGVRLGDPKIGEGAEITQITAGSAAEKAKLKVGEVLLKIDGVAITGSSRLSDLLADKEPNDTVTLTLSLAEKVVDLKVALGTETSGDGGRGDGGRGFSWDARVGSVWHKEVYRLAVVCVEYPDVKHNDKVAGKDWEEALFSRNSYVNKNSVTGQPVYGSLNDYYQEQSFAALRVEGKVFDWVEVGKKRAEYSQSVGGGGGGNRSGSSLLTEALDKLLEREGKEALKDFDGIFYVYAGDRVQTNRGDLYWPHRASVSHQGKRWAYFICPEGGSRMSNISVICHEFGHMLGLPDLYARPENPGSEGLGVWCAMSNQVGTGRPQHFSAWCKEQLTWLKPAVIDPTVKQKLILAPVEDSPKECFKVLVKPDGSEYLLLENRRKKGFDQELPSEGLLIWRVVNNKPILEESHGVEGPSGPRVFMNAVPYPSPANNAFTPYTTPSSRSQMGGGLPVHITNIRRLADGRVTFYVGYEYE
jgi:M6 family metalloprotease-like protein